HPGRGPDPGLRGGRADLLAGDAVPPRHRGGGGNGRRSTVIPRYSLPEMASLWSDEHRFSTMLEVEILAVEAWSLLGTVPAAAAALEEAIGARARELRDVPMVGRTHGIHAEPTTMGAKLALWALQVRRDRERLVRARHAVSVGKLSGAVGTYSNVDPAVERYV